MSRTQSQGLKYAQLDVEFFSDPKIRILKARYGPDGITVLLYILTMIYREGWYTKYNDDLICIVADDLGLSRDKVEQVITFLLGRSMFDEQLARSDAVLTSAGIQERWQEAVKQRASKTPMKVDGRYWLLNAENTRPFIQVTHQEDNSGIKGNNSGIKGYNSGIMQQVKLSKVKVNKTRIQDAVSAFNRICVSLEKIELTGITEPLIASLCERYGKEELETLFRKCEASGFLSGKKENFKANFKWLAAEGNAEKVLSGKYDDYQKRRRSANNSLGDLKELEEIARRRAIGKQEEER